jgi:hypothetical protein
MKQAASDLERRLEDTDCRVPAKSSERHCPRPRPRKDTSKAIRGNRLRQR